MPEKGHVNKLSIGQGADQERYCYFTIFNCDDHTCADANTQGCNNIIECGEINTGGSEHDGICRDFNYGGCVDTIACRPSQNKAGAGKKVSDIDKLIRMTFKKEKS